MIGLYYGISTLMLAVILMLFYKIASFLLAEMKKHNVMQRAINETNRRLQDNLQISQNRVTAEQELRLRDGEQEKTNILYKFDLLIEESNIKKYIKFMNTELYLFVVIIISAITMIISLFVKKNNLVITLILITTVVAIMFLGLFILSAVNRKKVERNIIAFVNLLANYNYVSNDIITILDNMYPDLEEPLKQNLKNCVIEARNSGNVSLALNHLRFRINHEMFQDIVRNIETCSRHKANYTVIAEHARGTLIDYLEIKEINKRMAHSFKLEMTIIIIVAIGILVVVQQITGKSITAFLFSSLTGNFLLLIIAVILFFIIYQIIQLEVKAR